MRKILIIVMLIFFNKIYGQVTTRSFDFILVIDEKIPSGSITDVKIKIMGEKQTLVNANYFPGNLSIDEESYNQLFSSSTKAIFVIFVFNEYRGNEHKIYNYDIELKKPWLKDNYNILQIYNLDKSKYKGRFDPIGKGKNYNYELTSPSHSFRLIQRKT